MDVVTAEGRGRSVSSWLPRRRLGLLLLAGWVGGCASLLGPRTVVISDAEMSRRLAARFPIERRWLEIFDLHLTNPRVNSDAQSGRLRIEVDVRLGQRLTGSGLTARLQLFARPRYVPGDHSIRITDVAVDALKIEGNGQTLLGNGLAWPSALLAQALEDRTIYQLNDSQLADLNRQGLVLRRLDIGSRGLQLHLEPA